MPREPFVVMWARILTLNTNFIVVAENQGAFGKVNSGILYQACTIFPFSAHI